MPVCPLVSSSWLSVILFSPSTVPLMALSTHPANTQWGLAVLHTYFNPGLKILTICLAAKTPSTMAQQKAAITPKLIKTIEATSCGGNKTKVFVSLPLLLLLETRWFLRDCQLKQNSGLTPHEDAFCSHASQVRAGDGEGREGATKALFTFSRQAKKFTLWVYEHQMKWRLAGIQHAVHDRIWLHDSSVLRLRNMLDF